MTDTESKTWAILIGINFYPGNKSLKGCVHDVTSIAAFLTDSAPPMDIKVFTASQPSDPSANGPPEESDLLPTYDNITRELRSINSQARAGDAVYIHYSGHGADRQSLQLTGQDPHIGTEDFALVLYDGPHGMKKLPGSELARLLKAMVDKKLAVTLVLDCCFSGSVTRHGVKRTSTVRSIDFDSTIDDACSSLPPRSRGPLRDGRIVPHWLVNPDGYTILCACGPYEIAEEFEFEDGTFHGALSYFLLRALKSLRRSGMKINSQALYQHICARFHAKLPRQNPRHYGNGVPSCFGNCLNKAEDPFTAVFFPQEGNRLCLRAGYAHGVQKGDEYEVCPFTAVGNEAGPVQYSAIRVNVSAVRGLTSDMVSSDPTISLGNVKSGWIAKPRTQLRLQNTTIQLMTEDSDIGKWQQKAGSQKFLRFCEDELEGQPCLFKIHVNSDHEYEVIDQSSQPVATLPTVSCDRKDAMDLVVNMLEHVAIYKSIEAIENRFPSASFSESFVIQLATDPGVCLLNSGVLDVKTHNEVKFTVRNCGEASIYVHLLDLRPSWEVFDIVKASGSRYIEVPGNESSEIKLEMTVPDFLVSLGQSHCEDVLKFLVTSRATSIEGMCLKELPRSADSVGTNFRGDQDRVSNFLMGLGSPLRGNGDDPLSEDWAALNFVVRTALPPR
ncbi:uncharacterized protein A1O9_10814 [Exophiala aquamarina CBS 119918]|uniref:Peptidase C14 caspase domain-containing protein n=1 Tax=Exophiala aquamarina CBS 119918 TaxID=1182545 RepID=A0A072P0V8_9EURO|nr:uncharacterized protein A1O9_10814 [Exophiala aquamarina CBS 119918]KEF52908.1 hypothetical protein A1O9_10814 [Exophiala aquamarina CBS 119918]